MDICQQTSDIIKVNSLQNNHPPSLVLWLPDMLHGCTTANSNLKLIQTAQNKFLRLLTNCHIYHFIDVIHANSQIPFVKQYVQTRTHHHCLRLANHQNHLALSISDNSTIPRRLKRNHILNIFFAADTGDL